MYNMEQEADLELIREAHEIEAVEAAKRIIDYEFPADDSLLSQLGQIAVNINQKTLARAMAIYTLGFVDTARRSAPVVRGILADSSEQVMLRDHAAEALGNMLDRDATDLLTRMTSLDAWPEVRESAKWALEHMASLSADLPAQALDEGRAAEQVPDDKRDPEQEHDE